MTKQTILRRRRRRRCRGWHSHSVVVMTCMAMAMMMVVIMAQPVEDVGAAARTMVQETVERIIQTTHDATTTTHSAASNQKLELDEASASVQAVAAAVAEAKKQATTFQQTIMDDPKKVPWMKKIKEHMRHLQFAAAKSSSQPANKNQEETMEL